MQTQAKIGGLLVYDATSDHPQNRVLEFNNAMKAITENAPKGLIGFIRQKSPCSNHWMKWVYASGAFAGHLDPTVDWN